MNGFLQKTPKVALFLATNEKAGRDKLQGILRYVRLHTPWSMHLIENRIGEQQLGDLSTWGATGVVVARRPDSISTVARARVPTVVIDSPEPYANRLPDASYVTCDSVAIGNSGAESFLRLGFTHYAYVSDTYAWDWSTLRGQAYCARLREAGFRCDVYGRLTAAERKDWTLDQKRLRRWLMGLPKPVAILAAHDGRARQVLETCQLAGLNVPGDVALLGVDNDELLCENMSPTLSSIQPDFEAGGYEAARLLEQLMRQTVLKPQTFLYGVKQVVVRESSRFAHAVDHRFLRGLEFIRLNACASVGVEDVARHMTVSRRTAEMLFRKHLGCSILDELQRTRLSRLKTFLLETAHPIGMISTQCGYRTEMHAKRVFKEATGMTMRQFRSRHAPKDGLTSLQPDFPDRPDQKDRRKGAGNRPADTLPASGTNRRRGRTS